MKTYSNEQCQSINLDESELMSLEWKNEGCDLKVETDWSGQLNDGQIMAHNSSYLHFRFVTKLEINFSFKSQNMGKMGIDKLLIVDNDGMWSVRFVFEFQPVGHIQFVCDSLEFVVD